MKPKACKPLRHFRVRRGTMGFDDADGNNGAFLIPMPAPGPILRVVVSDGGGWDHVSVSTPSRCPTWEEMAYIKRLFFKPSEVVMQLHVADADHINLAKNCLHLWRPQQREIPMPHASMV